MGFFQWSKGPFLDRTPIIYPWEREDVPGMPNASSTPASPNERTIQMDRNSDSRTLEELIVEINAQRDRLASAVSASSDARSNETSERNRLNELQKEFDKKIESFKKDSRDHESHWPEKEREQLRNRNRIPDQRSRIEQSLDAADENGAAQGPAIEEEEPAQVARRGNIEIDSRNGATKRR